jgi:hypothetical protein
VIHRTRFDRTRKMSRSVLSPLLIQTLAQSDTSKAGLNYINDGNSGVQYILSITSAEKWVSPVVDVGTIPGVRNTGYIYASVS